MRCKCSQGLGTARVVGNRSGGGKRANKQCPRQVRSDLDQNASTVFVVRDRLDAIKHVRKQCLWQKGREANQGAHTKIVVRSRHGDAERVRKQVLWQERGDRSHSMSAVRADRYCRGGGKRPAQDGLRPRSLIWVEVNYAR
jgi:hypothetical protein